MTNQTVVEVSRICIHCGQVVIKKIRVNTRLSPAILADFRKAQSRGQTKYTICSDCALKIGSKT